MTFQLYVINRFLHFFEVLKFSSIANSFLNLTVLEGQGAEQIFASWLKKIW